MYTNERSKLVRATIVKNCRNYEYLIKQGNFSREDRESYFMRFKHMFVSGIHSKQKNDVFVSIHNIIVEFFNELSHNIKDLKIDGESLSYNKKHALEFVSALMILNAVKYVLGLISYGGFETSLNVCLYVDEMEDIFI